MKARWAVFALAAIACGRADTAGDSTEARGVTTDVAQPWVAELGRVLFQRHGFAFEATSILILVAMIGAVVLARREAPDLPESEERP